MSNDMQRIILLAIALLTPGAASACALFSLSEYDILAKHLDPKSEPYLPDATYDVPDLLGCEGAEVARDGDTRVVSYQNPDGATIAIRWRGAKMIAISQSGLN